ncbi:hypothetical protein KD050_11740 [Psychrobacillus sp. INOP01]|uniref:LuxR C-terminal-related transcriptional regulator n=1 Tax=Psychrobacillus sp. INOP01 TaxID=2829187 RepID=UPI001BA77B70|nr:LuxR C-terminal-related transcriptional regulator [Psychrobacillus sp. INOP01]QUG39994.1 hypothetical protein KD050_11740 [Psychrobacillus sp. INOP01]
MQMVWLSSKTTVPRTRNKVVKRDRLNYLLQHDSSQKITIVRAPAGYGKTTLLSQWFNQSTDLVAWMSIDKADNDPIRFWKYVVHTVSNVSQSNIDNVLSSLFNSQEASAFEFLIDTFLYEMSLIPETIHIVVDDYHLVENDTIHQMMVQFIEFLPENIQVYLTSRTDLPLPIAKWRVKSWLREISMEQLSFTYEEAKLFYEKNNLLSTDSKFLQHAWETTEGWAAGLQLASLAMGNSTTDDVVMDTAHPFITEFLLQEILSKLPASTQDFLIRTSLLNTLEPVLCDALMNRSDSYDVLVSLENKGLFIARLHTSQPVFRYHHLFAEALQVELRNRYSQELVTSIVREVATLLRDQGDFITAIELALNEQDYELAESWITAHLVELFTSGQTSTFMRWVQIFRFNNHPVPYEMLVMDIIALISLQEIEEASQLMTELEYRQLTEQWMDKSEYQGIVSIYENVKAYALFGMGEDLEKIESIIQGRLEKGIVSSRWDNVPMRFNLFEHKILRTSIGAKGKLVSLEKAIPFANLFRETEYNQSVTAFSYGTSAETLYEKGYIEAAWSEMELAIKYGHQFKDPGLFIPMYILKSHFYAMKGQFVAAHSVLDYAIEMVKEKHWINSLHTMKARCYLLDGDLLKADAELFRAKSKQPFWLLVNARSLTLKGQIGEALSVIIGVKMKALQESQISTIIEASILEAVCEMSVGNEDAALSALHEALEHGAQYEYVRTFLDEEGIIPLLQLYLERRQKREYPNWNSVELSYVEQLVESKLTKSSVLDILTPREQEVFSLLKEGSSNREIAERLILSEGTVRVYLTNIYSKLGVNSRAKAILLK